MSTPQIMAPLAGPNLSPLPILTPDYANGQRMAVGASAAASTVISAHAVILAASGDCFFKVGVDPTASVGAGSMPIFAGQTLTIGITPGHKISVIRASIDGNLTIMPVAEVS